MNNKPHTNILCTPEGIALYEKLSAELEGGEEWNQMATSDFQAWVEAKVINQLTK